MQWLFTLIKFLLGPGPGAEPRESYVPKRAHELPWLKVAKDALKMHEQRTFEALSAWLKSDGATVGDPRSVPWCGDFVETSIKLGAARVGKDTNVPKNPYLAANWSKYGIPTTPRMGAILVFWRGSPNSWKGHVGFYVGEDKTHFHVLGGNQSNAVTVTRIAKDRLRKGGCRWPSFARNIVTNPLWKDSKDLSISIQEE